MNHQHEALKKKLVEMRAQKHMAPDAHGIANQAEAGDEHMADDIAGAAPDIQKEQALRMHEDMPKHGEGGGLVESPQMEQEEEAIHPGIHEAVMKHLSSGAEGSLRGRAHSAAQEKMASIEKKKKEKGY